MKKENKKTEVKSSSVRTTGLRRTASGFALAGCILLSLLILPMCWMIPMTVSIRHKIRDGKDIGLGLPICYMIFGGVFAVVAGILLCVDYGQWNKK